MGESLDGVQIELQVQLRAHAGPPAHYSVEIAGQLRPVEGSYDVPGQVGEGRGLAPAKVPSREPMVPRVIRKLLDRAAVDLLDFGGEIVLLEELREGCVEPRVGRIAVDLAPIDGERLGKLLARHEAGHVTIED